jgi:hypothetical protein
MSVEEQGDHPSPYDEVFVRWNLGVVRRTRSDEHQADQLQTVDRWP